MKYRVPDLTFIAIVALLLISTIIAYSIQPNGPNQLAISPPNKVPNVKITLKQANIDSLNTSPQKTVFDVSTLEISDDRNSMLFNDLEIKSHGNSTWEQAKKPYQIKFQKKEPLFGFKEAKNWILLANYLDPSQLKNDTALFLEHLLDQNFALNGSFVNLSINNNYLGLYYLTEKIELNKTRIHLSNMGGILVEYEGLHSHEENSCYSVADAECLVVKDVVNKDQKDHSIESFLQKYELLYESAKRKDYETIKRIADVDSFAKYYLLSDITLNPDSFVSSYFLYMDGGDDKIHVGPGWDFDLAFEALPTWGINYGLTYFSPYQTGAKELFSANTLPEQNYSNTEISEKSESTLIYYLLRIPDFASLLKTTYANYIQNHEIDIIQHIDSSIELIKSSAEKNNSLWGLNSFSDSAQKHRKWVQDRLDYLKSFYGKTQTDVDSTEALDSNGA